MHRLLVLVVCTLLPLVAAVPFNACIHGDITGTISQDITIPAQGSAGGLSTAGSGQVALQVKNLCTFNDPTKVVAIFLDTVQEAQGLLFSAWAVARPNQGGTSQAFNFGNQVGISCDWADGATSGITETTPGTAWQAVASGSLQEPQIQTNANPPIAPNPQEVAFQNNIAPAQLINLHYYVNDGPVFTKNGMNQGDSGTFQLKSSIRAVVTTTDVTGKQFSFSEFSGLTQFQVPSNAASGMIAWTRASQADPDVLTISWVDASGNPISSSSATFKQPFVPCQGCCSGHQGMATAGCRCNDGTACTDKCKNCCPGCLFRV